MNLILALETSSSDYGVAVCTPQSVLADHTVRRGGSFEGIGHLVTSGLETAGASIADLTHLAVDVGPGNLSSVRTGIAYLNGLAFSLGRTIFCANSLELLAREVAGESGDTVLSLRKAGGGNAYAGLFRGGRARGLRHGPLPEVVRELCQGEAEVTVAGAFREEVSAILSGVRVKDTGVAAPHVRTLAGLLAARPDWSAGLVPVASPLTETSPEFSR